MFFFFLCCFSFSSSLEKEIGCKIRENEMIKLLTPTVLWSKEEQSQGLCKPCAGQLEEQGEPL